MTQAPQRQLDLCQDAAGFAALLDSWLAGGARADLFPTLHGGRNPAQLRSIFPGCTLQTQHLVAADPLPPVAGRISQWIAQCAQRADPERLLLTVADPAYSLPALWYGFATGRTVRLVPDFAAPEDWLTGLDSVMLAGPASLFDKQCLKRLMDQAQAHGLQRLGLLTGRDTVQVHDLVAKLLLYRDQQQGGPGPSQPDATSSAYIAAHGNEMHLNYRDGVLCGRSTMLAQDPAQGAFDCGIGCRFAPRYHAQDIAEPIVFLLSCDAFTPADGFAPATFNLLFALLDGPACNILAPYKHIQANDVLMMMVKAMATANYALGDIAWLANGRSNRDCLPDHAFLVLGDPELALAPTPAALPQSAEFVETSQGVLVTMPVSAAAQAVTLRVPVPAGDRPLALLPVSEDLRSRQPLYALGMAPGGAEAYVSLFDLTALPAGPMEFAVVPAEPVNHALLSETRRTLDRWPLLEAIIGADPPALQARDDTWRLLRMAAAFPRPIEALNSQIRQLHLASLLQRSLGRLKELVCDALLASLGEQRLWISQEYVRLYDRVVRAGPDHDRDCRHCRAGVTAWRYEDPLTQLPDRVLGICDRCGIVADDPVSSPVDLDVATIGTFTDSRVPVSITVTNRSPVPRSISLAVQLNRWKIDGVSGENCRADFELDPGQQVQHRATLVLPDPFQDDVLPVQTFVVTDGLDLVFASQKVIACVRPRSAV